MQEFVRDKPSQTITVSIGQAFTSPIDMQGYGGGMGVKIVDTLDTTSVLMGYYGIEAAGLNPVDITNFLRIRDDIDGSLIEQTIDPTADGLYVCRPEVLVWPWLRLVFLTSGSSEDIQAGNSTLEVFKLS